MCEDWIIQIADQAHNLFIKNVTISNHEFSSHYQISTPKINSAPNDKNDDGLHDERKRPGELKASISTIHQL